MLKLKRWFSSNNDSSGKDKMRTSSISIRKKLDETLEKLEGKERVLQSKISIENERARDFTKSKNKKDENARGRNRYGRSMMYSEDHATRYVHINCIKNFMEDVSEEAQHRCL